MLCNVRMDRKERQNRDYAAGDIVACSVVATNGLSTKELEKRDGQTFVHRRSGSLREKLHDFVLCHSTCFERGLSTEGRIPNMVRSDHSRALTTSARGKKQHCSSFLFAAKILGPKIPRMEEIEEAVGQTGKRWRHKY